LTKKKKEVITLVHHPH